MTVDPRLDELEAERVDLLEALHVAEQRAHQAARTMYRRGYLAGHSAGRKNARKVRGPYGATRHVLAGTSPDPKPKEH